MSRIDRFKFLCMFGDGRPMNWFQVVAQGCIYLKMRQTTQFEPFFKKMLEYGLILQVDNVETLAMKAEATAHTVGVLIGPGWQQYDYILAPKGDECLRNEQIERGGDVSYYKYFDRTVNGPNGLNKYAPLPSGFTPVS